MKIREGAYYRTRGGQVFGPMVPGGTPASDYVWCLDPLIQGYNWDSEGSWRKGWDGPLDLISEVYVSDTPPADVLTLPSAMLKPQEWRRLKPIEFSPETKTLRDEFAIAIVMALLSRPLSDNDLTPERCKIVWDNATAMMEARRK